MLSRGEGAQVSLLTLTRGESGDNALGPELFDALGLIRTEELLLADRYYGVDRQYFGTVVDYGFSKRLDETLEKWGIDHVLRDIVGVIRTERPLVRHRAVPGQRARRPWQPLGRRDGDAGSVQAGGRPGDVSGSDCGGAPAVAAVEAVHGRRARERGLDDPGRCRRYDPVLGDSYQSLARLGLSFQRSQNGGRFSAQPGPSRVVLQAAAVEG